MYRRYVFGIKVIVLLCSVIGFLGLRFATSNGRVQAQSNNETKPLTQEAKPFDQEQALAALRKAIAGQENKPAGEVFKNVLLLKQMPAARLLKVMELGYSRSLGVTCTHCHVADQWEKDDKPTKPIAREMFTMMGAINNDYLKKIKNLKSETPIINCTTCHRGQTKPELNMPESKAK
jgi:hypothetical protein